MFMREALKKIWHPKLFGSFAKKTYMTRNARTASAALRAFLNVLFLQRLYFFR